ncbi:MAG: hypothetical protein OEW73_14895 [Gammaproteobacteria bacterium]|jgi:hypothetical protein|nr:hypothetical protein [Gammaproteobacteria bacterium]MDH5262572.1 hypothetical protein [Gammaproteobacteria bacterium]MDH5584034.1 hypothetical protein [Gammaproteobacteria bacterium]
MPETTNEDSNHGARGETTDRYFLYAAATLLVLLVVGFSPTLFLKAVFKTPELPIRLHLHGAVITLWFVWLLSQVSLIALDRTDAHRRFGKIAAVFGFAVIPAGISATLGMVGRARAAGADIDANVGIFSSIVWGNLFSLVAFFGFLVFAIYFRGRPDIHKRLMLFASFVIMGPVFARISFWPMFSSIGEIPFVVAGILTMMGTLFVHDLLKLRRIHAATAIGGLCIVLSVVLSQLFSGIGFAQNFVRGL